MPAGSAVRPESAELLVLTLFCTSLISLRYMNDPDAANAFLARYVENQPPDPDLGISGVVRADELVKHLVAQYRNRLERNVAHLKALFR